MRLGDTDRAIARAGLVGRRKAAQLRLTAEAAGWLDVATPLPGDGELAVHLGSVRTQPAVASLAEPHRDASWRKSALFDRFLNFGTNLVRTEGSLH